jgi:V8-like Glu-specific endopeptidase
VLERVLRGVGRIETNDPAFSFVGTAFLIDSKRAVTASFVAQALFKYRKSGEASGELDGVRINFKAEYGSTDREDVAVRNIRLVHPYWGFAFLELAQPVDATRVLWPAAKQSEEDLRDREICVVGYPASDSRNEPEAMKLIFGDIFEVKRVMPGTIMGMRRWGAEDTLVLRHDATTSGGTSGAPLVDSASGEVLGIQVGGAYAVENYAVAAWEIGRDPQWSTRSNGERAAEPRSATAAALQAIEASPQEPRVLAYDEVIALHKAFAALGAMDENRIRTLLGGLPTEYVGALPGGGGPSERLLSMLHAMNEIGGRIGKHSAFYYVLKNAGQMRGWDANWTQKVQDWLTTLREREAQLK